MSSSTNPGSSTLVKQGSSVEDASLPVDEANKKQADLKESKSSQKASLDTLCRLASDMLDKESSRAYDPITIKNYGLVDIWERDDCTLFYIDAPGLKKDNIDISITNNHLNVVATRKPEYDVDEVSMYSERYQQEIERNIMLPANSDVDNVSATYQNGVIIITLGKIKTDENQIVKKIPVL